MPVLLTLWGPYWAVFTFPPCIHLFAARMPVIFVLRIKMAKGLISIWLTLSLTFRVYFFNQRFSSAWPQTLEVKLLKPKPLQKCSTHFLCLFLQSSTDAFIQMLILCTSAMPYCTGMSSSSWVQLYFDNMIVVKGCFAFARAMLSEVPDTDPGKDAGSSKNVNGGDSVRNPLFSQNESSCFSNFYLYLFTTDKSIWIINMQKLTWRRMFT